MTLNFLQILAEAIAAVSVMLSVIYLAIQVKRNTSATYSQTYQFATASFAEMAAIVGASKETSRVFTSGMADPDILEESEYSQFAYLGISLLRRFENIYFQHQSGMIDDDFWTGHRDNLLWFHHQPGFQKMWQERRCGFSEGFREFLDHSSAEEIKSPDIRKV